MLHGEADASPWSINQGGRKMFCWKCGKEIPDESLFCSYCGAETKNRGNKDGEPIQKKQQDYRAFVAIGLIILLLLAAATILIGTLSKREKADTAAETPLPAEGSPTAAESPAPAETPAPTEIPEPTETPRPRFISPEQYARENGLDWPEGDYDPEYTHSDFIDEYYGDEPSIWRIIKDTVDSWDDSDKPKYPEESEYYTEYYDEKNKYTEVYIQARADGKSDLEAHEIGLEEAGVDRRILGKEESIQFVFDSAIENGASEYEAGKIAEQEGSEWDIIWYTYKYARDTGGDHEDAIATADWKVRGNGTYWKLAANYEKNKIDVDTIDAKRNELLQYWYEIKREDIIK